MSEAIKTFYAQRLSQTTSTRHLLGENPSYDARTDRFVCVDILGCGITVISDFRKYLAVKFLNASHVSSSSSSASSSSSSSSTTTSLAIRRFDVSPDSPGFALPTTNENVLICGSQRGIFTFDLRSEKKTFLLSTRREQSQQQHQQQNNNPPDALHKFGLGFSTLKFNDAAVDSHGTLLAGMMVEKTHAAFVRPPESGALFSFSSSSSSFSFNVLIPRITISNGLGWSNNNSLLYYIDTHTRAVDAFSYLPRERPLVSSRRRFFDFSQQAQQHLVAGGRPDGLAVCSRGNVFVALIGAGKIVEIDCESRRIVSQILLPRHVLHVTSLCLVDNVAVITTAIATSLDVVQRELLKEKEAKRERQEKNNNNKYVSMNTTSAALPGEIFFCRLPRTTRGVSVNYFRLSKL